MSTRGSESRLTTFQYDNLAPVTSGSNTGGSGWIVGTTSTVTLSRTDSESGVASTTSQINGGQLGNLAAFELRVKATDAAGNVGTIVLQTLNDVV